MNLNFLDFNGLITLANQLEHKYTTNADLADMAEDTSAYIIDVDYSQLEFDKTAIIE